MEEGDMRVIVRKTFEDGMFLALRTEEGVMSQEIREPIEAGGTHPSWHLDFSPVRPISDF